MSYNCKIPLSDFLITIEEYVGAKGNALVDHKKIKNIKDIKKT